MSTNNQDWQDRVDESLEHRDEVLRFDVDSMFAFKPELCPICGVRKALWSGVCRKCEIEHGNLDDWTANAGRNLR